MSRQTRQDLIRAIEEKRESKVITYITSDRLGLTSQIAGDVVSILHSHILQIVAPQRRKIDLVLYSRGGDADIPWSIVSMFREYCEQGSFSVLIPYRAHSAATVIALGADEIVMTKKAELGPIDATLGQGPYNPKDPDTKQRLPVAAEDVMGYFSLLERVGCERPDEKMAGFAQLTNQVHPLVLGHVSRILEQTQMVALRLLGTRAQPFTEERNREIIRRLSSEIYSHQHTISRTEAKSFLGLDQVVFAEECDIDQNLWDLYANYCGLFSLEEPFFPDRYLLERDLDENTWPDMNTTCIESLERLDLHRETVRVRRLRTVPPTVNLSLADLRLPSVVLPNLPAGVPLPELQQQVDATVRGMVQSCMGQLVQDLGNLFLKAMPIAGFERTTLEGGWTTEG